MNSTVTPLPQIMARLVRPISGMNHAPTERAAPIRKNMNNMLRLLLCFLRHGNDVKESFACAVSDQFHARSLVNCAFYLLASTSDLKQIPPIVSDARHPEFSIDVVQGFAHAAEQLVTATRVGLALGENPRRQAREHTGDQKRPDRCKRQ